MEEEINYPFRMLDEDVAAEKVGAETVYAFPQSVSAGTMAASQGGLTLREAFAMHAFGAAVGTASGLGNATKKDRLEQWAQLAEMIYEGVDAMIAAGKPRNRDGEVG